VSVYATSAYPEVILMYPLTTSYQTFLRRNLLLSTQSPDHIVFESTTFPLHSSSSAEFYPTRVDLRCVNFLPFLSYQLIVYTFLHGNLSSKFLQTPILLRQFIFLRLLICSKQQSHHEHLSFKFEINLRISSRTSFVQNLKSTNLRIFTNTNIKNYYFASNYKP